MPEAEPLGGIQEPGDAGESISVALCTHNGARFVEEQLLSILRQSEVPRQIVVSDDASSDGTVGVVRRTFDDWLARTGRDDVVLQVLENAEPLGVTANFEAAVRACTGTYILLSDQDDVWHEDKVSVLAAAMRERPELSLVNSDARMVDAAGHPSGRSLFETLGMTRSELEGMHGGAAFDVLLRRNVVTGATVMLRADLRDLAMPFPPEWVHDEWLAVVAAATGAVDTLESRLIDYRQHGGNQIGATSLTGSGRIQRLRAPRTERNARLLGRARALADRLPTLTLDADTIDRSAHAAAKLAHEEARSALPAARWRRLGPVLREFATGRYDRYGLGAQDVLRDLVQPV